MRTAESRDLMVARVRAAFAAHGTFDAWPEVDAAAGDLTATPARPLTEASYVTALYEICASGEPLGRNGDALIGNRIDDEAPQPEGRRLKVGRGEGA